MKTVFSVADYWLFEVQALKAVGLTDHPKAGKLFEQAWHIGHEGGFSEVLECLIDLTEMELGNEQI